MDTHGIRPKPTRSLGPLESPLNNNGLGLGEVSRKPSPSPGLGGLSKNFETIRTSSRSRMENSGSSNSLTDVGPGTNRLSPISTGQRSSSRRKNMTVDALDSGHSMRSVGPGLGTTPRKPSRSPAPKGMLTSVGPGLGGLSGDSSCARQRSSSRGRKRIEDGFENSQSMTSIGPGLDSLSARRRSSSRDSRAVASAVENQPTMTSVGPGFGGLSRDTAPTRKNDSLAASSSAVRGSHEIANLLEGGPSALSSVRREFDMPPPATEVSAVKRPPSSGIFRSGSPAVGCLEDGPSALSSLRRDIHASVVEASSKPSRSRSASRGHQLPSDFENTNGAFGEVDDGEANGKSKKDKKKKDKKTHRESSIEPISSRSPHDGIDQKIDATSISSFLHPTTPNTIRPMSAGMRSRASSAVPIQQDNHKNTDIEDEVVDKKTKKKHKKAHKKGKKHKHFDSFDDSVSLHSSADLDGGSSVMMKEFSRANKKKHNRKEYVEHEDSLDFIDDDFLDQPSERSQFLAGVDAKSQQNQSGLEILYQENEDVDWDGSGDISDFIPQSEKPRLAQQRQQKIEPHVKDEAETQASCAPRKQLSSRSSVELSEGVGDSVAMRNPKQLKGKKTQPPRAAEPLQYNQRDDDYSDRSIEFDVPEAPPDAIDMPRFGVNSNVASSKVAKGISESCDFANQLHEDNGRNYDSDFENDEPHEPLETKALMNSANSFQKDHRPDDRLLFETGSLDDEFAEESPDVKAMSTSGKHVLGDKRRYEKPLSHTAGSHTVGSTEVPSEPDIHHVDDVQGEEDQRFDSDFEESDVDQKFETNKGVGHMADKYLATDERSGRPEAQSRLDFADAVEECDDSNGDIKAECTHVEEVDRSRSMSAKESDENLQGALAMTTTPEVDGKEKTSIGEPRSHSEKENATSVVRFLLEFVPPTLAAEIETGEQRTIVRAQLDSTLSLLSGMNQRFQGSAATTYQYVAERILENDFGLTAGVVDRKSRRWTYMCKQVQVLLQRLVTQALPVYRVIHSDGAQVVEALEAGSSLPRFIAPRDALVLARERRRRPDGWWIRLAAGGGWLHEAPAKVDGICERFAERCEPSPEEVRCWQKSVRKIASAVDARTLTRNVAAVARQLGLRSKRK